MANFGDRLAAAVSRYGAGCIGIDPHLDKLPAVLRARLEGPRDAAWRAAAGASVREFSLRTIVAATGVVGAVKPQVAFYEALGAPGIAALEDTVSAARAAGLLVVLDGKRGDIGSTAEAYAHAMLDDAGPLGADAATVSPYLGAESLTPFIERTRAGKGVFVLLRTSNPGAGAWQTSGQPSFADHVAEFVASHQKVGASGFGAVGVVVGATLPNEAQGWRARLPNTWFLVPGYGAQGATAADVRKLAPGALIVSARGVLFPARGDDGDDWAAAIGARARAFAAELSEVMP